MEILRLEHVEKSFGTLEVIRDVSFTVGERSVFGLIGKNGAGKTTTMKMILGLLKASGGEITVCGEQVAYGSSKTNRFIGYLPDVPEFYGFMRPKEYLKLCGEVSRDLRRVGYLKSGRRSCFELVGLGNVNRKIGGFSRGMKQRLGIAQALAGRIRRYLICDEPTSALDPVGRKEILDILSDCKGSARRSCSRRISSRTWSASATRSAYWRAGRLVLSGQALRRSRSTYRSDKILIETAAKDRMRRRWRKG